MSENGILSAGQRNCKKCLQAIDQPTNRVSESAASYVGYD